MKNIICLIFGHRWGFPFEYVHYKWMNNSLPSGNKRMTKRRKKKKVVDRYHECLRCKTIKKI